MDQNPVCKWSRGQSCSCSKPWNLRSSSLMLHADDRPCRYNVQWCHPHPHKDHPHPVESIIWASRMQTDAGRGGRGIRKIHSEGFFPIEPPHAIVDWYDSFERISLFGMFGRHFGTQTLRNPFKKLSTCWKALVSNLPQPLKMLHGEYEQNPFWYTHCTQMSRRRIYLRKKRFQSWLYLQEATWRNETRAGGTNCTEGTAEVGSQAARGSQSVWSREPSRESSTTSTSSGGVEFSGGKVRCDFLQIALLI